MAHGTKQMVSVFTKPAGATISTGEQEIISPGTLELPRKSDHTITISKPGHKTEIIRMCRVMSGATGGNILLPGGLIGWGIDAASGAQWDFEVDTIDLSLCPLTHGEKDTAMNTVAVLETLKEENELSYVIYESLKTMTRKNAHSKTIDTSANT